MAEKFKSRDEIKKQSVVTEKEKAEIAEKIMVLEKMTYSLPGIEIIPEKKKNPGRALAGEKLSFTLKGFPLPDIHIEKGELIPRKKVIDNAPIFAELNGTRGPLRVKCEYNEATSKLSFTVPDQAVDSNIVFMFPVMHQFGSISHTVRKNLSGPVCFQSDHYTLSSVDTYIGYYPFDNNFISVQCQHCRNNPVCPNGAIKFTEAGQCYVDSSICIGQSCTLGDLYFDEHQGRLLVQRADETKCFRCFEGNESLSLKCHHRKIGRVMNSSECVCGTCVVEGQLIKGKCLRELCEFGAISGGQRSERCGNQVNFDNLDFAYVTDKSKCIGCYRCYDNIICSAIKMEAYIRQHKTATLKFTKIRIRKDQLPTKNIMAYLNNADSLIVELKGRSTESMINYRKVLPLRFADFIHRSDFTELVNEIQPVTFADILFITLTAADKHTGNNPFLNLVSNTYTQTRKINLDNLVSYPFTGVYSGKLVFFRCIEITYELTGVDTL